MTDDELDQELQRWSAQLHEQLPPPELAGRILRRLPQRDAEAGWLTWLTARLWRPALIAALPVLTGFFIGLAAPADYDDLTEEVALLAFAEYTEPTDAQP